MSHDLKPPRGDWFRTLVERSDDVAFSWRVGPPAGFAYVNPAVERLTGLPPDAFLADPDLLFRQLAPPHREVARRWLGGELPLPDRTTLEFMKADGEAAFAEVSVQPAVDADGTLLGVDGIARDVTDRVTAERRAALEGRLLGSIRDGVVATDDQGLVTFWNAGAERLSGLPARRAIGSSIADLVAHGEVTGFEPLAAAIEATAPWSGDLTFRPRGRPEMRLEIVSYPVSDADIGRARIHIAWDVTEDRLATDRMLRLATAVHQAEDAIFTIDEAGLVGSWNAGAEHLTGISAAQAIGRPGPFLMSEEVRADLWARAFAGEPPVRVDDAAFQRADGSPVPVAMQVAQVRDDAGAIVALSVIARDDRPRRDADRTHRLHEGIIAAVDDALVGVDLADLVVFWSPSAARTFGVSVAEAMGRPLRSLVGIRPLRGSVAGARRLVAGGGVYRGDVEYTRPDGSSFIGEVTIVGMDFGGQPGRIAVVRDVTAQRAATVDSTRLAAIVESAPVFIVSTDPDGNVLTWNEAAEDLLGYPADEMVGRTLAVYVAPASLPVVWEMRRRVLDDGETNVRGEVTYVARAGTGIPVWLSLGPVRDSAGRIVAVSTVAIDLRERRALEASLRRAERLEAASRLAGGIGHDFTDQLTAITGYGRLLEAEVDPATSAAEAVRQILRAADHAADLTRSLRSFSRLGERTPHSVLLDPLLDSMLPILQRRIPEHVEVRTNLRSAAAVRVDVTELELALVTIATNTAGAMPAGGTLVIETSVVVVSPEDAHARGMLQPGPHARLAVGTGSVRADRAGTPVTAPAETPRSAPSETSLRLAIAYAYVDGAGGSISVEPADGGGTTVEVLLPLTEAPEPPVSVPPATDTGAGTGERVLLVEDDPLVRALVTAVLRRSGYALTVCGDPRDAAILDPDDFDVLLSDIVMPGLEGPDVAARLRARRPDLPVVFMSGFAEDDALAQSATISEHPLLRKPFSPAALLMAVRSALDDRRGG